MKSKKSFHLFIFTFICLCASSILFAEASSPVKTTYEVRHLFQNIDDDDYTENTSLKKINSALSNTETKAEPLSITGFTAQDIMQKTVESDGSTVVYVCYDCNLYTVSYNDGLDDEEIEVPQAMTFRYGSIVPVDFFFPMVRRGFLFSKWTDGKEEYSIDGNMLLVIREEDVSLTAQWVPLYYSVNKTRSVNGTMEVRPALAKMGETITVSVSSDAGYEFFNLTASDWNGTEIPLKVLEDGKKFSFVLGDSDVSLSLMCIYLFHTEATPLEPHTDGTAGPSGEYVLFGDWPSDAKKGSVKILPQHIVTMGNYTYYLGDDGNYYARVMEKVQASVTDEMSAVRQSVTARYFRVNPIKWRILTRNYNKSGHALLLSEHILTAGIPYYVSIFNRLLGEDIIYANNYKYSNIRAYLNGYHDEFSRKKGRPSRFSDWSGRGFLQTAFTAEAQKLIPVATVDNGTDSTADYGGVISPSQKYVCENTEDKVFLLSEQEVTSPAYGFDTILSDAGTGNIRIRSTTPFARCHSAYQNLTDGFGGWWWLRSPHFDCSYYVRVVGLSGVANYTNNTDETSIGIVPAILYDF